MSAVRRIVLAAILGALVTPSTARAGDLLYLESHPVAARAGFVLTVRAAPFDFGDETFVDLQLTLRHRAYTITQEHIVEFNLPARALTHTRDLSRASIATGPLLGRWGRVDMTFRKLGGPRSRVRERGLCRGTYVEQRGVLEGRLTLATGTALFGTIRVRRLNASLVAEGPRPVCTPDEEACLGPGGYLFPESDIALLTVIEPPGMLAAGLLVPGRSEAYIDFIDLPGGTTPTYLHHALTVAAPNAFVADSFRSARLDLGVNTWVSGTVEFRATQEGQRCGEHVWTEGSTIANVTARFAWGGTRTFTGAIDGGLLVSGQTRAGR